MVCAGLDRLAELAAFFSVPASSGKFHPPATNQKVGSSSPAVQLEELCAVLLGTSARGRVNNSWSHDPETKEPPTVILPRGAAVCLSQNRKQALIGPQPRVRSVLVLLLPS